MDTAKFELSMRQSNALKGIALIMLLIHHLFHIQIGEYDDLSVAGYGIVEYLAIACKTCVALFVLLSGYALGATNAVKSFNDIPGFYKRRFIRLYSNYWFIWAIYVFLGVYVFGRTLTHAYGSNPLVSVLLDLSGVINLTGPTNYGYNPTWWFYSCIIVLYLIFPIIALTIRRWPASTWMFILLGIVMIKTGIVFLQPVKYYVLPFVVGFTLSNNQFINRYKIIRGIACRLSDRSAITALILSLAVISAISIRIAIPDLLKQTWDTVIALSIVLAYYNTDMNKRVDSFLEFTGRHSSNIFLFHSLIFLNSALVYWNRNPLVILPAFLSVCLVISIGLEQLKKALGFNLLVNRAIGRQKVRTDILQQTGTPVS